MVEFEGESCRFYKEKVIFLWIYNQNKCHCQTIETFNDLRNKLITDVSEIVLLNGYLFFPNSYQSQRHCQQGTSFASWTTCGSLWLLQYRCVQQTDKGYSIHLRLSLLFGIVFHTIANAVSRVSSIDHMNMIDDIIILYGYLIRF